MLVIADADRLIDAGHKDLAIADFARARSPGDCRDGLFAKLVWDDDFNFDLWQKVDRIFPATVELGMAFLAAMTARFQNGHAFNACLEQGVFHSIQLGGLENCFNFLHKSKNLTQNFLALTRLAYQVDAKAESHKTTMIEKESAPALFISKSPTNQDPKS